MRTSRKTNSWRKGDGSIPAPCLLRAKSRHSDSSIAEFLVSIAIVPCVILWRFIAGWAVVAEDIGGHRVDAARGAALAVQ